MYGFLRLSFAGVLVVVDATVDRSHNLASSNLALTKSWSKVPSTPASLDLRLGFSPTTNW